MRSRDIFGRLRLRLRLRGSIPAPVPAPAPSKTVRRLRLRLRAKCTGSGGSGSGSGSDDQVLIWALTSITIFKKCQMSKYYFLLTWPWVWMPLWRSAFEICHSLSSKATGWHWRGHRLLRVALSEISALGHERSFATDTQRILNIRRRISPKWRFWSVAWPNLIKDFLDVQIIQNACFWQWRKFQVTHSTCSKVIDEKYRQSVCSAVCYFAVNPRPTGVFL